MIVYKSRGWTRWHIPDHHGLWDGRSTVFALCGKRIPVGPHTLTNGHEHVDTCATCATKAGLS